MSTLFLRNTFIESTYTVVGKLEDDGPLAVYFDQSYPDHYHGETTYEHAEVRMIIDVIRGVMNKAHLKDADISIAMGGDLTNQIAVSNYAMEQFQFPFIGVYGACSTSMLALALASVFVEYRMATRAIAYASSHNATTEKQFRYPNEYGNQRPPASAFTVTGSGAALVSSNPTKVQVTSVTFGRVKDYHQDDVNDMGSAMAIAAYDTLTKHLQATNTTTKDYDLIVTGDLASVGSKVLKDVAAYENIILSNHNDCGLMIYDVNTQPVFAGGSGCACCAVVTFGYLVKLLEKKEAKKILVIATGALHSPVLFQQYKTIPVIAHAVCLEAVI